MTRRPSLRRCGLVALVSFLALLSFSLPGAGSHGTSIAGGSAPAGVSAAPEVRSGTTVLAPGYVPGPGTALLGPVPPSTFMNVLVGLPSHDLAGESAQAAAEYVPGSGQFHQYLTPSQIANRFGAGETTVAAATTYFTSFGLDVQPLSGGTLLSVTGPVRDLGPAFGTTFGEYRDASGRTFVSHPTPASLPSDVPWTGAFGLGDAHPLLPFAVPLPSHVAGAGPDASCSAGADGLSPCQVWGAYDAAGLIGNGTNGAGVRIAVVDTYDSAEPESQLKSDLTTFDTIFGLGAPTVAYNYPVPSTSNLNASSSSLWGLEEALDLEWSHASAPGATLEMTFSPNSGVGLYEAVDWLVSGHRADVISMSWGEPDLGIYNAYAGPCSSQCNASSDGSYEVLGPVLEAAALEGISVFAASGDCGSADGTSGVSTNYPSSDPFTTGVGGTVLSLSGTATYLSESAWSGNSTGAHFPGCQNGGGTGGGYAPFPRPWWQAGTGVPSSPGLRGDPDVSDDAATGVEIVEGSGEGGVGGTSLASPLWAGVTAIADQYAGGPLGFLNPSLYSILRSSNYSQDFHDITGGNNGAYSAHAGWDPVTGIGTPVVGHLVRNLARNVPVQSSLAVDLAAGPRLGHAPLTVDFQVTARGGSGTYPLEGVYFGDGNSALAPGGSASHLYPSAGVFGAVAFAVDSSGNTSVSDAFPIVVGGGVTLQVNLSATTVAPAVGASVQFTATVYGGTTPYSYSFAYGDGTGLNWTGSNSESHAYPVAGGFCAEVLVRDSATPVNGGASAGLALTVGGGTSPTCANDSTPLTVTADAHPPVLDAPADYPSLFQVVGGSYGAGSGSLTEKFSSSDPYVAACGCSIFRSAGNYSVTLNASDPVGDRVSNETNVTVAPTLVGNFTASRLAGPAPLTVEFNSSVSGGWRASATNTTWSFGNGATATGASVLETYSAAGLYFATGAVSDQGRGNASSGFMIDVLPPGNTSAPTLTGWVWPVVNVTSGSTVWLTAHSTYLNGTTVPAVLNWTLWDGASTLDGNAAATFRAPALGAERNLTLGLSATWPTLGSSTSMRLVSPDFLAVEPGGFLPETNALVLNASAGPDGGRPPTAWNGTASATGPGTTTLEWTFGDGGSSTTPTVQHAYATVGTYTAYIAAADSWGDTAQLPFGVDVHTNTTPPLSLTTHLSTERGEAPLVINFSVTASGGRLGPYTYNWTFGDGAYSGSADVQHTYGSPGLFTANLTVVDSGGTKVQEQWTIQVTPAPSGPSTGTSPPVPPWVFLAGGVAGGFAVGLPVVWYARRRSAARPPSP